MTHPVHPQHPDMEPPRTSSPLPPGGTGGESAALDVHDGDVWAFFAFDVGNAIELEIAQKILRVADGVRDAAMGAAPIDEDAPERTTRDEIRHRRRSVSAPQFHPAPLRVDQPVGEIGRAPFGGFRIAPRVECTVYDFGAISVGYRIPVSSTDGIALADLVPLTQAIMEGDALRLDAERRVRELASRLRSAVDRPEIAAIVEDYTVVHLRRWRGAADEAMASVEAAAPTVARVLLAEPGTLARHSVESTISGRVAYAPSDAAVVDWNGALLIGTEEEDSITVLEFANVELLEMRHLDDRLDAALDRAYASLLRRDRRGRPVRSPLGLLVDPHRAERRWLADLQMESAVLFENANNTLKLVGDQHLARLYTLAARRLHLADWDQSILRKLETVEGLYQKLADEQAARRMEFLEWIIIILIAVSIVLPFLPIPGMK